MEHDKELSAIKALAEAATPGPWERSPFSWVHIAHSDETYAVACCETKSGSMRNASNNATFIAAANPQALLSLISRVEQAEAKSAERAIWWAKQEALALASKPSGASFRSDRPSYQQMHDYALAQRDMFDADDESIACFCGD